MNKKISRIFAVGIAILMCALAIVPVSAASGQYEGMVGENTFTTYDKYLILDENANVPNVAYAFGIRPYTPPPPIPTYSATQTYTSYIEVQPGIGTPVITWDSYKGMGTNPGVNDAPDADKSSVSFSPSDRTWSEAQDGDYVKNLTDGRKYAKHTATVDFSGIVFPAPGIYRYVITETGENGNGMVFDANPTRYLDVYVEDASTDEHNYLTIAGFVLHANAVDVDPNAAPGIAASDYKDQGFTNEYVSYKLSFSKTVQGNYGSREKYFKFTLSISNALPETKYTVLLTNADATVPENASTNSSYVGKTNPTQIITDDSGTATATFYLQHGQSITILGLAEGTHWYLSEVTEGYSESHYIFTSDSDFVDDPDGIGDTKSGISADTEVQFINTREGFVPTGVLLTVAPFAVLMLVGITGSIIVLKKKNKKESV